MAECDRAENSLVAGALLAEQHRTRKDDTQSATRQNEKNLCVRLGARWENMRIYDN